ncbi:contractile injection system protein, VgrG/Pvc8 family [Paenibacillus sp. FSL M7-0802]|uniref:phage baseplate assembly protein V n=1 Tax=Paenibacillus TaxID=44249 RepID=UPI002222132B|nr:contractile injection system protein, VgrG/Pvc8 family [Paenibacillus polymyxa]
MDKVQETSGYRHVELLSKVPLQTMTDIRIERRLGDHVRLVVSGIVPEEKQERFMELESEAEPVEVIEKDKDGQRLRTLFHGQMTRITLKQVHGIHYVQLEAISHTIRLDVRPVTRSFQDHTMTYGQLLKQVLTGYTGADVIDTVSGGAQLGALTLQYRETDWAFLKRMASRFGAVLVPEAAADSPKFWFGIPEGRPATLDEVPYHSRKSFVGADGAFSDGDGLSCGASSVYEAAAILGRPLPGSGHVDDGIKYFWSDSSSSERLSAVSVDGFMGRALPGGADLWHIQTGIQIGMSHNEANTPYGTSYTVESARYFRPGDVLSFQGKELLAADIVSRMDRGLFLHTYTLVSEDEIRQKPIWNHSVRGASLEGRVLEVERDQVRVHLTIDAVQEREKACWLPYATGYSAEGHSGWYVMPEKGDMVQVQFPTLQESDGFAARSVRRSGKPVPELGNPDIKYWGTPHDKLVKLSPQELLVSAKTDSVYISLDAKGIQVYSDHALSIAAKRGLTVHAEDTLDITANEAIYLQAGSSSMVIDGETDIRSSQVKLDGIIKRPVFVADLEPVPEPPLMSIKAYQAAHAPKSTSESGTGSPNGGSSRGGQAGKAGASPATPTSPKVNLLGGILNVAQKALSIIGTVPVLGTPARIVSSKLTSIRRDVAKGGSTRALKYAAAGLSMLAGVPSGGWAVLAGRNLAREAVAFNRRVAAYKKNGVGQRYAAAYRGKVWTAARNVASSRSLGELVKSLAHNMDKLNTEYHKIPLEVRAGWRNKKVKQLQPLDATGAKRILDEKFGSINQNDQNRNLEFEEYVKNVMVMREGEAGFLEEKERLRNEYERYYKFNPNRDFETWFARLTQTSKVESNSETKAQWAFVELILNKKDPYPRPVNPELKGKTEPDVRLETAMNAGAKKAEKEQAEADLKRWYQSLYKGKQQQTFEEWFAHLTSSDEMEAEQALSEFRGKIALESAISQAQFELIISTASIFQSRQSTRPTLGIVSRGMSKGTGAIKGNSKILEETDIGSTIKNKFPNEGLPKDGKILTYTLENGRIKGINGRTQVDFVIDKNGELVIGKRHHTLGNRDEVLAAGQLKINGQGEVRRIDNKSGHYRPTVAEASKYPELFEKAGVKVKGGWIELYKFEINKSGYLTEAEKVVSKKIK